MWAASEGIAYISNHLKQDLRHRQLLSSYIKSGYFEDFQ